MCHPQGIYTLKVRMLLSAINNLIMDSFLIRAQSSKLISLLAIKISVDVLNHLFDSRVTRFLMATTVAPAH